MTFNLGNILTVIFFNTVKLIDNYVPTGLIIFTEMWKGL